MVLTGNFGGGIAACHPRIGEGVCEHWLGVVAPIGGIPSHPPDVGICGTIISVPGGIYGIIIGVPGNTCVTRLFGHPACNCVVAPIVAPTVGK
jgi:hypothetical protein